MVSQNDLLVKSTEGIKSDISQRDWSKQKRWEMQREVAVEVMRLFGTMLRGVSQFWGTTVSYNAQNINEGPPKHVREEWEAANEATETHVMTYWQLEEVCRLVFSENVRSRMADIKDEYQKLTTSILNEENYVKSKAKLDKGLRALLAKQDALSNAIRTELGF